MNAPLPPSGDFRSDPDYAAGQALHATGGQLPIEASAALMRGYLDAVQPRERPDWANGPGLREPFTTRVTAIPHPKSAPAAVREALAIQSLPREISIFDDDGKLLRPDELRARYINLVRSHCGGDKTLTGRLLDLPRRTVQRVAQKRWKRT